MTITHHASEALLLDYATGALDEAWSLAVAAHASLCAECRSALGDMERLGGALLETAPPHAVDDAGFDAVLARLDSVTAEPPALPVASDREYVLPAPIRRYLGGDVGEIPWRRLGVGARQVLIPTGTPGVTTRLLRIPAGKPVPAHSHGGLELTLVFSGAYSDSTGHYGRGDFQEADPTLRHQPHAAPGEDCICLAVTDAPLAFSSPLMRLVQPLIGI